MTPQHIFLRILRLFANVATQTLVFTTAFLAAFCLRFELDWSLQQVMIPFWKTLGVVLAVKLAAGYGLGTFRGLLRYVGLEDMLRLAFQVTGSTGVLLGIRLLSSVWLPIPLGVLAIDWAFSLVMLLTVRVIFRTLHEGGLTFAPEKSFASFTRTNLESCLIIGAGDAGEALLRDIHLHPALGLHVVGFLDPDPTRVGGEIRCVPVLGIPSQAVEICHRHHISQIFIAMPHCTGRELRHLLESLGSTGVPSKILPAYDQLVSGEVSLSQIREVSIEDLLHREPVQTDLSQISNHLRNQVVMVTGAGGSIGSELCRQILSFGPSKLILAEQAENNLFFIEQELLRLAPEAAQCLVPAIVDVTDVARIKRLFRQFHPSVVFHAAAHKHVPMMEGNPSEAVKNNILGTRNVVDLAHKYKTRMFVMISTDKAVNPTSVMGTTKRIAEMYAQAMNSVSATRFMTVRFGNVLGSTGSVIPTFKEQIRRGGPVTVTHPDMRRFFMTIPEAVQLVLQASVMGSGGEIFTLDMGEPVKIADLARDLIRLSGLRPDEDIEIVFTGLRPGEKLYEELHLAGEDALPTRHPKITATNSLAITLNQIVTQLDHSRPDLDTTAPFGIKQWLHSVVNEYTPDCQGQDNQLLFEIPATNEPLAPRFAADLAKANKSAA